MNEDERFHGVLGSEYDLFTLSVPHHDEFQKQIPTELRNIILDRDGRFSLLEIGSGTGTTTKIVLQESTNFFVTSVDNENVMLDQLVINAKEWGATDRLKVIN